MGFLKKLGQILAIGIELVTGIGPILSAQAPSSSGTVATVTNDLNLIAGIIAQAEAMGASLGLPGPDKLKAAAPMVAQIILSSSLLAGKKIQDTAKFQAGVNSIAGGMADVLSSLDAASIVTTPVVVSPPTA